MLGWLSNATARSKEAPRLADAIREARRKTQTAMAARRAKIQRAPADLQPMASMSA